MSQPLPQSRRNRVNQAVGFLLVLCPCRNPQYGFPILGIGGNSRVGLRVNHILDRCFHRTLSHARNPQDTRNKRCFLLFRKVGLYLIQKHRYGFFRRPRQHHNHFPVFLYDNARRSAVFIIQHNAVFLRHHCLLYVVFRHFAPDALKEFFYLRQCFFIKHEILPEIFRRRFLCQIVLRRPKAAGGDDEVGA